jgi:hypothetical protein
MKIAIALLCIMCYISTMETTHIYTLAHPVTGVVRYVGKANKLQPRYSLHLRKDEGTAKSRWIQSLRRRGLLPVMEVLDIVPSSEWQFWEMYWIGQLKAWGCILYNGDNGGLGTDRLTANVKGKISKSLSGRPQPAKWVQVNQYDLAGNYIRSFESSVAAAAATNTERTNLFRSIRSGKQAGGFLWTSGANCSASIPSPYNAEGKIPFADERRQAISNRSRGQKKGPPTEETRAKMRVARLGKSPANKGIAHSPEQRAKIQAASTTKKAVCQYTLAGEFIKEFPSIKAAAVATNATRAGILKTINGENSHSGGFKWSRERITLTITNPA